MRHHDEIKAWLEAARPLRLTKVHELLRRDGLSASYWTLRRYAASELGWRKSKPTIRLDDPPAGEQAQVDFGDMGYMVDPETGRRRMLRVLIGHTSLALRVSTLNYRGLLSHALWHRGLVGD